MSLRTVKRVPRKGAEPRRELTHARLREAANELFLKQGVEKTTVDQIVAKAGVSKGTFYLHFDRKEDLLLEYGMRRLQRVREMLPELISGKSFREALEVILDTVVRGKTWGREVTGRAILEIGTSAERLPFDAPHRLLEPLLVLAQARGEVRSDIPAGQLAQFVLRSIMGALRDWGLGSEDVSRDAALDWRCWSRRKGDDATPGRPPHSRAHHRRPPHLSRRITATARI